MTMTTDQPAPGPTIRLAVPDDAEALSTFLSHMYSSTYSPYFGSENIARHFQPLLTVDKLVQSITLPGQVSHIAIAPPDLAPPSGPIVGLIQTREEGMPARDLFPGTLDARDLPASHDSTTAESQTGDHADDRASACAYVSRLYVHEAAHGTGLARELLSLAEGKVVARGYKRIWLKVLGSNARAVRFYEKSSYQLVGQQVITEENTDEGGDWAPRTDLIMLKRLDTA